MRWPPDGLGRFVPGFGYNPAEPTPSRHPTPLNSDIGAPRPPPAQHRAFASFANRDYRILLLTATAAMMGDNIEHVISYWVMFQKFHSPALGAFAVVSHWVPYLLLGAFSGRLADRFDIRRLIQIGMLLLSGVSIGWGVMFMTDSAAVWKAMVLLVIHGLAGVIWIPAAQVLIHRIVSLEQLPSGVRLFATGRYLGFLVGPVVGDGLLQVFGAYGGIFINALIYVPLLIWLVRTPYGSANSGAATAPAGVNGFADVWATMQVVARSPVLSSMTILIGASAFFVGNAYQAQMPGFAVDLGHANADFSYGVLLAADAGGGPGGRFDPGEPRVVAPAGAHGIHPGDDLVLCAVWIRPLEYLCGVHQLLFVAGFVELGFNAMAQSLVQLNAPAKFVGGARSIFDVCHGTAHL